jgi:Mannosyl-glycoprotein endo-beta-N-acetylglucosaminidase
MGFFRRVAVAVATALIFATPVHAESTVEVADTPPPPAAGPIPSYQTLTPDSSVLDPSLETAADLDAFLAHTHLAGMGSEFVGAEARTGVNARFLFGITWTENNAGASTLAQTQHNLFSFVGSGPGGWAVYDSYQQSIQDAADYIGSQYARPGGSHYRGGTIAAIGSVYAADPGWAGKVATASNFIGPSRGAPYAASLHLGALSPAGATVHVTNDGFVPWELAPGAQLVLDYRWARRGESRTGTVTLAAPPLRSGGEADLLLPGVVQPDGDGWRLLVSAELTGSGWAEDLGGSARDVLNPATDQASTVAALPRNLPAGN